MGYWIVVDDDEVIELKNAKNLRGSEDMRISCLRSGADLLKFMEMSQWGRNSLESVGSLQSDSLHAASQTVTSPLTQDCYVPTDSFLLIPYYQPVLYLSLP